MQVISRAQAKEQGLKRYYTGKPCKHGHIAYRVVVSKTCEECLREYHTRPERHGQRIERYAKYNEENRETRRLKDRERHWANREKRIEKDRRYRESNPEKAAQDAKKWRENNRARSRELAMMRTAKKKRATPPWYNREDCIDVYRQAKKIEEETGIKHEVDHIVPLQSDLVCGLHVAANLRVISREENKTKGNRHWPDMPD